MTTTNPDTDRPLRGRRLTPAEFYKLTGRKLGAANDNEEEDLDGLTDKPALASVASDR